MADISDDEILEHVKAQLLTKYPDLPDAELDRMIHEEFEALRDRPVRDFLEVLTTRAVKQRVKADRKGHALATFECVHASIWRFSDACRHVCAQQIH